MFFCSLYVAHCPRLDTYCMLSRALRRLHVFQYLTLVAYLHSRFDCLEEFLAFVMNGHMWSFRFWLYNMYSYLKVAPIYESTGVMQLNLVFIVSELIGDTWWRLNSGSGLDVAPRMLPMGYFSEESLEPSITERELGKLLFFAVSHFCFFRRKAARTSLLRRTCIMKMKKPWISGKDRVIGYWYTNRRCHCSRVVPPFVTAYTFCASWVWLEMFGFLREFA